MFKWSINERLKHCVVGLTLILSIVVIVCPSLFKNESVNLDDSIFSTTRMPSKPHTVRVRMPDQATLFKTVKVAHVDIQAINAKARSLAQEGTAKRMPVAAKLIGQVAYAAKNNSDKKDQYAVQLASFNQLNHAKVLVDSLKSKGVQAYYNKQGKIWRVLVGQLDAKPAALDMQQKLARLQLKGYVIKLV